VEIKHKKIDDINGVITITIYKKDYQESVLKILNDYKKKANIPGFRKGHVPLGLIKKKYENTIIVDEANKLISSKLQDYLKNEKIDILGNPIPKDSNNQIDWKLDSNDFEFDIGFTPNFEVKLSNLKNVIRYNIDPEKKMVSEQMLQLRNQYGKLISRANPEKNFEITANFKNEESNLNILATFKLNDLKDSKNIKKLKSYSKGKVYEFEFKSFFKDESLAKQILKIDEEKIKEINGNIFIDIKEINERIPTELNQTFFNKLYEPGSVKDKNDFENKIKDGLKNQFKPQSDQKLLNDITECLIEKTKFKLPEVFLKKWMQVSSKEDINEKQSMEEFKRSEKGIRYQIIESKIIRENNLESNQDELKQFASNMVKNQMFQYGQIPEEKQVEGIVSNILSKQDEVKRISDQLMSQKLLKFYKEKAPLKVKKMSFNDFIEKAYGRSK
jgi:trigger factor